MPNQKFIVTDPIELRTAQEYFASFEEKGYLDTFNQCLGGVFNATQFKIWSSDPNFKGIFFWYCLDKGQVSVAAEFKPGASYDDTEIESYRPDSNSQMIEATNFIWSSGLKVWNPFKAESDFEVEILCPSEDDLQTTSGLVEPKVAAFIELVKGKGLSDFGFAYMSDKDGIELGQSYLSSFLGQSDLKYISYHFGFHCKDVPHGLRLVLIGRDSNGNPLKVNDPTKSYKYHILNGTRPPRRPPPPPPTVEAI